MKREKSGYDPVVAVGDLIRRHVGEVVQVFHEVDATDDQHIDVYHARSTGDVRLQWLFTSGMSRRPMEVPRGQENARFAELVICLPKSWPLTMEAFKSENNYWPLRLLKMLARYPSQNNTWLSEGHTVPYQKPFAPDTKMSSAFLGRPQLLSGVPPIRANGHGVSLWAVYPIYENERLFAANNGHAALTSQLVRHGVTEKLNPHRDNVLSNQTV